MNTVRIAQTITAVISIMASASILILGIGTYQISRLDLYKLINTVGNDVIVLQRDWNAENKNQVTPDFELEVLNLAKELEGFDSMALLVGGGRSTDKFNYYSLLVSPSFFYVRSYPLLKGRIFDSGTKEAVVGHDLKDFYGKTITVRGTNVRVVGVLKPISQRGGPDRLVDGTVFLPYDLKGLSVPMEVYLKFKNQEAMKLAIGQVEAWLAEKDYPYNITILSELYGKKIRERLHQLFKGTLLGMLVFLVIVTIANQNALSLTLALQGIREWGIRRTLGATASRIKYEAGLQHIKLLAVGIIAGTLLAMVLAPKFSSLTDLKTGITLSAVITATVILLIIGIVSIYPVLQWLGKQPPYLAIKGLATNTPHIRNYIALVLLLVGIAAIATQITLKHSAKAHTEQLLGKINRDVAVYTSFLYLKRQTLADPRGAAPINYKDFLALKRSKLFKKLDTIAYVDNYFIFSLNESTVDAQFFLRAYEGEYPELSGTRLILGKWPQPGHFEIVIGVSLAERLFGNIQTALGKKLKIFGRKWTISGIYKGAGRPAPGIADDGQALVLRKELNRTLPGGRGEILVRKKPSASNEIFDDIAEFLSARHNSKEYHPVKPIKISDMTPELKEIIDRLASSYSLLGILVLALAIFGMFTQTLINLQLSIRELGIRKAVGATNTQLWLEILKPTLSLATATAPLGVILGLFISVLIVNTYQITWSIPWTRLTLSIPLAPLITTFAVTLAFILFMNRRPLELMRAE